MGKQTKAKRVDVICTTAQRLARQWTEVAELAQETSTLWGTAAEATTIEKLREAKDLAFDHALLARRAAEDADAQWSIEIERRFAPWFEEDPHA